MNRHFDRNLQMSLISLDLFVLNLVYFISQFILRDKITANSFSAYIGYWFISNGLWLFIAFLFGTYADNVILIFQKFLKRTIQIYLLWIIFILFYLFFSREFKVSRLFIIATLSVFGTGLLFNRFLYLGIKNYFKKEIICRKRSFY